MTAEQIEARREEVAAEIRGVLEEARVLGEEVEREMEGLRAQREMERGIWERIKAEEKREGGGGG